MAAEYGNLIFINLTKSLNEKIANKIFIFNNRLETALLSDNNLKNFPRFCRDDPNMVCNLRRVYFESNNLKSISSQNMDKLFNLNYLNLNENSISSIESESFLNLVNLETLILSRNLLRYLNDSNHIFNCMYNLKYLDLSFNSIEYISSYEFSRLYKLKILDLSHNAIRLVANYSFYMLNSLRDLHINSNDDNLQIEMDSFIQIESLQRIYLSESILNTQTKSVFIQIFKDLNRNGGVLRSNRAYFKSLSLISSLLSDCNLKLYFIRNNVHYNFKSDDDSISCSQLILKSVLISTNTHSNSIENIFSNFFFYLIWIILFSIFFLGIYSLFKFKNTQINANSSSNI